MSQDADKWVQCRDGELLGPFGVEELRERARRGELTRGDLIGRPGGSRWVSALSVVELYDFQTPARNDSRAPFRSQRLAQVAGVVAVLLGVLMTRFYAQAIRGAIEQGLRSGWSRAIGGIGAAALVIAVVSLFVFMLRRRMQTLQEQLDPLEPTELIRRAGRAPILYLRSFEVDSRGGMRSIEPYERLLRAVFEPIGPLIAIGRPGERLQSLGAARLYVGDDWREIVHHLMRQSRLVILRIGETEGFWWEVEQVASRLPRQNILFFLPKDRDSASRRRLYQAFRDRAAPLFGGLLPEALDDAEFLGFDPDGRPRLCVPREPRWRTDLLCGGPTANAAIHRQALAPLAERLGERLVGPASTRDCLALPFSLLRDMVGDLKEYARDQKATVQRGENRFAWGFVFVTLLLVAGLVVSSWARRPQPQPTLDIDAIAKEAVKRSIRDLNLKPGFDPEALKKAAEKAKGGARGIEVDLNP